MKTWIIDYRLDKSFHRDIYKGSLEDWLRLHPEADVYEIRQRFS